MVISKKILVNITFTLGLLLVLLSAAIIFCSKDLVSEAFVNLSKEKLLLIRELKKQTLENFFLSTQKQVASLAKQAAIKDIFEEFKNVFDGLLVVDEVSLSYKRFNPQFSKYYSSFVKKHQQYVSSEQDSLTENLDIGMLLEGLNLRTVNLQTKYLANVEDPLLNEYANIHDKYHKNLQNIVADNNYNDLLLVDLYGNVVYSVQKNIDFANSILSNHLATTELMTVFNKVKYATETENTAELSNFTEYLPDYQEPVCFVGHKIGNLGILLVSVKLSHVENLIQLPTEDLKTTVYLLDKDSRLISQNNFGKKIYTAASKNLYNSIPGNIEGLGKDKLFDIIYFTSITGTNLNLLVEFKKSMLLFNLIKPLLNIFYIAAGAMLAVLFLVYLLGNIAIVKNNKKFDKISEFIKTTIINRDLSTRISLENDDLPYNLVDLLNNMLGLFHNILEQVVFKIKKIVEKHNELLNKITLASQSFITEKLSFQSVKDISNKLSINVFQVQHESQQYQNLLNEHKKIFLNFDHLVNVFAIGTNKASLSTSLEYMVEITKGLDKLFSQINFGSPLANHRLKTKKIISFCQEIRQLGIELKPKIVYVKNSLTKQISEDEAISKILTEFFDKLRLVNSNINSLLDSQKSLLSCSNEQVNYFAQLQQELLDLELKYNNFNQQLLEILKNNVKLNEEIYANEENFDMQSLENKLTN